LPVLTVVLPLKTCHPITGETKDGYKISPLYMTALLFNFEVIEKSLYPNKTCDAVKLAIGPSNK